LFRGVKSFYSEEDVTEPLNVYGKTKLESERVCLANHKNTIIIRTNFFGWSPKEHKPTFAEWILNNLKEEKEIKMFKDVFFTPIEVSALAKAITRVFDSDYCGILNIAGKERISKYEFGIRLAKTFGFNSSLICPTSINDFNFKAPRQPDLSLSVKKFEDLFSNTLPDFNTSLKKFKSDEKTKYEKTIILGAGLAGLSAAYYLEKKGDKEYLILEAESEVGGLARSIKEEGFIFDFGPHMLHKNEEVAQLMQDFLKEELILNKRKAGVVFNGKIIPYPFQHNLYHLDEETKNKCVKGVLKASENFKEKNPINFREWIEATLGEEIASCFMIPYNAKCYCIDPKEITLDVLGKSVPQPTFEEIVKGANSDMSEAKAGYYNEFYYPKNSGIEILPKAIAKSLTNIKLNQKIIRINLKDKKIYTEKEVYSFEKIISTIPLKELVKIIEDAPKEIKDMGGKLVANKACAVLLGINRKNISPYNFLYIPQKDILPYRLSFPMNSSEKTVPDGASSICAEYVYIEDKKLTNEEIIEKTINDLIRLGILKNKEEVTFKKIVEINPSYVIFDFERRRILEVIKEYLKKNRVCLLGRYGRWEYAAMEDVILQGKETALSLRV
jgi:UDP-galactopyranose mutase